MTVGKAVERIKGTAKFYRRARKDFAYKWWKIIDANVADSETITLFKKSYKGNTFPKEVRASDWKSEMGYKIRISSSSEQDAETTSKLQRMIALKAQFPDNLPLQRIIQKRMIEIVDLTPDEMKEVSDFEKQKMVQPMLTMEQPVRETASPEALSLKSKVSNLRQLASQSV